MTALETERESRSGLPGLGGRPSLHPAWSGSERAATVGLVNNTPQDTAHNGKPDVQNKAFSS